MSSTVESEASFNQNDINKILSWITSVDVAGAEKSLADLKAAHPMVSQKVLAQKIFDQAQWKCAMSGILTGLPSNVIAMVPAALLDIGTTIKYEIHAAAQVALLHDENFFKDCNAKWELLIPIFGLNVISQAAQSAAIKGAQQMTRVVIRKLLSSETVKQLQKALVKVVEKKAIQKAIATKSIPLVGGMIGGTWNWFEVKLIRIRTLHYFADGGICA